jgi:hypothetical protein
MADPQVSKQEALSRIIDQFVREQGAMYEHYIRPHLPALSDRIDEQLPLFDYEIVTKSETSAPAKAP